MPFRILAEYLYILFKDQIELQKVLFVILYYLIKIR